MKMMRYLCILLALCSLSAFAGGGGKTDKWPDGTVMDDFFRDTVKVDVDSLGRQYVITDYGVEADSTLMQTARIQAVIDLCASQGGGVVVIPEGTYLSGALFFKPGTHLHVVGKLKGSERIRDYRLALTRMEGQTLKYFSALVNADCVDGFTITGNGTIDGNGFMYWQEFWYRRLFNSKCTNLEALRPRLVYISNSRDVTVQDVHLQNSGFWTNHLYRCSRVRYLGCSIYAPTGGVFVDGDSVEHGAPSSDAIDIDVCHDVLVHGCYMNVNDDAVVIKGGKGTWADKDETNGPSYNVLVDNCRFGVVHGCLVLGSESLHDWNIVLRNASIGNVNRVLWLKMRPDTPQHYEKVRVEGVRGRCRSFLVVRPWTQFFAPADREDMPLSQCNDIMVKDIDVTSDNFFDVGTSDKYALRDFTFENCRVADKACAFNPELIEGCKVRRVSISCSGKNRYDLLDSVSGEK